MKNIVLKQFFQFVILFIFCSSLIYLAYIPRQNDFFVIFICFTLSFLIYGTILSQKIEFDIRLLIATSVLVRAILIFSFPNLSDDIYRFIWDGRLMHIGVNPYSHLPSELLGFDMVLTLPLFNSLNSPDYYSIYPPINQVVNYLATVVTTTDYYFESIIYKSILFVFDIISMAVVWFHLKRLQLKPNLMFLYFLNPLIIIETSGNGHFEGVMISFLAISLFYLYENRPIRTALGFSLSVGAKLLPLMFAPAILNYSNKLSKDKFILITIGVLAILFLPAGLGIKLETINFMDSIDLYVKKFEFNGSLYYLLRFIGYKIYGYNLIHVLGPILSVATLVSILALAYWQKQDDFQRLTVTLLFSFTIFLLLSRTVHPWYLCVPIFLCIFARFRFPIIWSYLITLTYVNYSYPVYKENMQVIILEYTLVFAVILWELIHCRRSIEIEKAIKVN